VFDHRASRGESGEVAGLGQDRRGTDRGQPDDGVTRSVSCSSSRTASMRASVPDSRRWLSDQSPSNRCTRSSAPTRWAVTPRGSSSAANRLRTIRRDGFWPPRRVISRRTTLFEAGRPKRRGSCQLVVVAVADHADGCRPDAGPERLTAVSRAAGQTYSSRARICWIWLTMSTSSCSRRAPRWRSLP
jgi:hypothetical protein